MTQSEDRSKDTPQYDWSDKVILVAEDTETSNMYFKAALKRTKVNILWASNGREALEIVKKNLNKINLILMDIHMPEMNGFEATREIKKIKKDITIIIQTAYVLSGEREKSVEAGCDDFITKPINFKKLLSTVEKYI